MCNVGANFSQYDAFLRLRIGIVATTSLCVQRFRWKDALNLSRTSRRVIWLDSTQLRLMFDKITSSFLSVLFCHKCRGPMMSLISYMCCHLSVAIAALADALSPPYRAVMKSFVTPMSSPDRRRQLFVFITET